MYNLLCLCFYHLSNLTSRRDVLEKIIYLLTSLYSRILSPWETGHKLHML